jgi:hypothetical protein
VTNEGVSFLQTALRCKFVAAETLRALNKVGYADGLVVWLSTVLTNHPPPITPQPIINPPQVYSLILEAQPDTPGPLLEWGRILASPVVVRPGEACVALEDAALLAADAAYEAELRGRNPRGDAMAAAEAKSRSLGVMNKAVEWCVEGLANFTAGVVEVRFLEVWCCFAGAEWVRRVRAGFLQQIVEPPPQARQTSTFAPPNQPQHQPQPETLAATSGQLGLASQRLDAPLLADCVRVRAEAYEALARKGVASRGARRAIYKWVWVLDPGLIRGAEVGWEKTGA